MTLQATSGAGHQPPALSVGAQLPTREAVLFHGGDPAQVVQLARLAEELEFDSVWVRDSLTARPRLEPMTVLAAVAATTRRVTIGTAILLAALRHPVLLAHQIASLDRLSDGRLVLGVGAGAAIPATETEFALVGVPFAQRVGRMYAAVKLWRHIWNDGGGEWHNRYWDFDDVALEPAPARAGGPPVWLAGEGPQTLRRAGAAFDGWLPFSATPAAFRARLDDVEAAARQAGRDPAEIERAVYLTVTIHDNAAAATRAQSEYIEAYYDAPYDFMRAFQGCCAGNAQTVTRWLQEYIDAGARHLVLRPGAATGTDRQLQRLAEVAAELRSAKLPR